ncbi:MAG: hypothetical protein GY718_09465 [Lentisphaerae bacterium]|nr:hypothetical protein [Lentisphaerota bacterium]
MSWDKGNERVMKGYNFRMNEMLWLKIKYITDHSPLFIQKFLESAVVSAVDKEIN